MKALVHYSTKFLAACWLMAMLYTATDIYAVPKPKIPAKTVYIAIVAVDPAAMTITVEPKNSMSTEPKTYKVTPATVVKVSGNPASLADLKPEMQVHFTLAADGTTATELLGAPAPRE